MRTRCGVPRRPCVSAPVLQVSGENSYERVSGSSIGGGTFWGLCRLLTGRTNFDEMLELSMRGDNAAVRRAQVLCAPQPVPSALSLRAVGREVRIALYPAVVARRALLGRRGVRTARCVLGQVDMLVGDIYGGRDYSSIGLSATTIASSFGKARRTLGLRRLWPCALLRAAA